ncbi:OmpA family protein [Spirosoma telluris]
MFTLSCLTAYSQEANYASCLSIKGIIIDYTSHNELTDVRLSAKMVTGSKLVRTSTNLGRFSAEVPCEATGLLLERAGYRTQFLSLEGLKAINDSQQIAIVIPLLAVDWQRKDYTYLQTEQKEYVQGDSASEPSKANQQAVQHSHFVIKDALRNTPLKASICFYYTKNTIKKCVDTDQTGKLDLDFEQRDIVAIEASAEGYQRYDGNLIIESVDGRSIKQSIKLQRELTILTVQAGQGAQCNLTADGKTYSLTPVQGQIGWYSTFEAIPTVYDLVIKKQGRLITQTINLHNGLNYVIVKKEESENTFAPTTRIYPDSSTKKIMISPAFRLDSLPMLYFEQSSYKLRADSKELLKHIALYLQSHKDLKVQVAGHTDNVGNERLNKDLSEFRAAVVTNFLTQQGISESRCLKVGYGSQYPISPNDTEANKALNRRVSLKLITTQ